MRLVIEALNAPGDGVLRRGPKDNEGWRLLAKAHFAGVVMIEIYTLLTVPIIKMHPREPVSKGKADISSKANALCFMKKPFVMQTITPTFWFADWGGEARAAADRRPARWEGV